MIHTTLLINMKSNRTIASSRYWTIEIPRKDITEYLTSRKELEKVSKGREDISLTVKKNKYFGRVVNNSTLLVFVADIDENDRSVNEKLIAATNASSFNNPSR